MADGRLKIGSDFLKIGSNYLRIGPATPPPAGLFEHVFFEQQAGPATSFNFSVPNPYVSPDEFLLVTFMARIPSAAAINVSFDGDIPSTDWVLTIGTVNWEGNRNKTGLRRAVMPSGLSNPFTITMDCDGVSADYGAINVDIVHLPLPGFGGVDVADFSPPSGSLAAPGGTYAYSFCAMEVAQTATPPYVDFNSNDAGADTYFRLYTSADLSAAPTWSAITAGGDVHAAVMRVTP